MATFDSFTKNYLQKFLDNNPNVGSTICKMMGCADTTDPMTLGADEICERMFASEMEDYEPFENWMLNLPTRSEYYEAMFKAALAEVDDTLVYSMLTEYFLPVMASEAAEYTNPIDYFTSIANDGVEDMWVSDFLSKRDCLGIYSDLCNDMERFRNERVRHGDTTVETYKLAHYEYMVRYCYYQICMFVASELYSKDFAQGGVTVSAA